MTQITSQVQARPDFLPQKFWDDAKGEARLEALAQSYRELERAIGKGKPGGLPECHEDYCIECKSDFFTNDPGLNARLHQAGFSQEQAQLVYDLAHEALEPIVAEIFATVHAQNQVDRLVEQFGGEERWVEVSRQIQAFGKNKLNDQAFEAMCGSYDGIMALYDMMSKSEPNLGSSEGGIHGTSEDSIRKLMRDPKYWRDRDPAIVERVREGFRRLYPD